MKHIKNKIVVLGLTIVLSFVLQGSSCKSNNAFILKGNIRTMNLKYLPGGPVAEQVVDFGNSNSTTTNANGDYSYEYKNAPSTLTMIIGGPTEDNGVIVRKEISGIPLGQLTSGFNVDNVIPSPTAHPDIVPPLDYIDSYIRSNNSLTAELATEELWIYDGGKYGLKRTKEETAEYINNGLSERIGKRFAQDKIKYVDREYSWDEIKNAKDTNGNPVKVTYVQGGLNNQYGSLEDSENRTVATYTNAIPDNPSNYDAHELIGRIATWGTPPDKYWPNFPSIMFTWKDDENFKPITRTADNWTNWDDACRDIDKALGKGNSYPDNSYYE